MNRKLTNPARYVFYDIESTSAIALRTQIVQIALIETDDQLNVLKDDKGQNLTHMFYIKLRPDMIPDPGAFLVHKVNPKWVGNHSFKSATTYPLANQPIETNSYHGLSVMPDGEVYTEREAILKIQKIMTRTNNTCIAGYNSEKFDDEVVRSNFYRNMLDSYQHEWSNGNHRADIMKAVMLTRMFSEKALEWPIGDDGKVSMRLEKLSVANGLVHENAHDALSDVQVTIDLAKLIKNRRPALWDKFKMLSDKQTVKRMVESGKPLSLTQMFIPKEKYGTTIALPVFKDTKNANKYYLLDLVSDIKPILEMETEELRSYLFTPKSKREGKHLEIDVNIRSVSINKAPTINIPPSKEGEPIDVSLGLICKRVGGDINKVMSNLRFANENMHLFQEKLRDLYSVEKEFDEKPIYSSLYEGFFSNNEKTMRDGLLDLQNDKEHVTRRANFVDCFEFANQSYENNIKHLMLSIYSKWGAFEGSWSDLHNISGSDANELILYHEFVSNNIEGKGEGISFDEFNVILDERSKVDDLSELDKGILKSLEDEVDFILERQAGLNNIMTPHLKRYAQKERAINHFKYEKYLELFAGDVELNHELDDGPSIK